ncbi:MAG: AAA family ATPase [Pseudomonadales bacterium]|nr:AAA family ATPase [Pseudomonadales bacterium]
MKSIQGYELTKQIQGSGYSQIYHAIRHSDQRPVVLKCLNSEFPRPAQLAQFRQESEIIQTLNCEGVIKCLELIPIGSSLAMVLEDFGGLALDKVIQQGPLTLKEFLPVAISISQTLTEIHDKHVIHKDINPTNILWNRSDGRIKVIDFGISTKLSREVTTIQNAQMLEGTIAYLSPEQTGRLNQPIDYRADFYSLGVTFFELLTGIKPFVTDDEMEMVHCHIAHEAKLVDEINAAVPHVLAMIVNKLMAKKAEERYQSATGLVQDLEKCQTALAASGEIEEFVIGAADFSDQLVIPKILFGREKEIKQLQGAFDRASEGRVEMLAVAGFSGVGKSSLINEIQQSIVARHGHFIGGKFDQLNRNLPYSAIVQALQDFARQILTAPAVELAAWKQRMLVAVGTLGQLIIDVVPEIEWIIGAQPRAPLLTGAEAKNRFITTFQAFIAAIALKEHPLVLFIDDLQWVDTASLALIRLIRLNKQQKYLLLIGAFRDNEVTDAHPLVELFDEFEATGLNVEHIQLGPLEQAHVNLLVSETLHCRPETCEDLSSLIFDKTRGNPFFVNQFISMLHQEKLLVFNQQQGGKLRCGWDWQVEEIEKKQITENVVDLLTYKMKQLSTASQKVLSVAAAIGNRFDIDTLALACGVDRRQTMLNLWPFVEAELLVPLSNAYAEILNQPETGVAASAEVTETNSFISANDLVSFAFQHDRVQQAAYSLMPVEIQSSVHCSIGMALLERIQPEYLGENIPGRYVLEDQQQAVPKQVISGGKQDRGFDTRVFEVVNQLNPAADLITDPKQRLAVAQLNLWSGLQAKNSAAFPESYEYFKSGLAMLNQNCWQTHYELTFSLTINATEVSLMTADYAGLETYSAAVIHNAKDVLDRVRGYETRMDAGLFRGDLDKAISTGIRCCELLGVNFPRKPNKVHVLLALVKAQHMMSKYTNEDILNLPTMTDSKIIVVMRVLNKCGSAALSVSPNFLILCILKRIELSLQKGFAAESIAALAGYAAVLCIFNRIEAGGQYADLVQRLIVKRNDRRYVGRNSAMVFGVVKAWKTPFKKLSKPLRAGYFGGVEAGDWEYAFLCMQFNFWCAFFSGKALTELNAEFDKYHMSLDALGQQNHMLRLRVLRQFVLSLDNAERSIKPFELSGEFYDDSIPHALQQEHLEQHVFHPLFWKTLGCYLMGEYEQGLECSFATEEHLVTQRGLLLLPQFRFYQALCCMAVVLNKPSQESKKLVKVARKNLKLIRRWSEHSAANYLNKVELIEALLAQWQGDDKDSEKYFRQSIASAAKYEVHHEEAIGYQLFAEFQLSMERDEYAKSLMQKSYYLFECWGSSRKCKILCASYPELLADVENNNITNAELVVPKADISLNFPTTSNGYGVSNKVLGGTLHSTRTQNGASNVNDSLDLYSVMKASQAISGEIILSTLLEKILALVLENAGAQNGVLIKADAEALFVEASATLEETHLYLADKIPLTHFRQASSAIINFVARSKAVVILAKANTDAQFSTDNYLIDNQIKSVLCYPLINQQVLTGVLYLENNLVEGAFTPDRVKVLEMLSSQLAAAIDNAYLYSQLETKSEQISHLLEATKDITSAQNCFEAVAMAISHILAVAPIIETQRCQFYICQKNDQSFTGYCIWDEGEPIETPVGFGVDDIKSEQLMALPRVQLDDRVVSIPVASEKELFAVLEVEMYHVIEDPSAIPADLLLGIVRSLALSMENIEVEEKSRLSNLGGMAASIVHDLKNPIGVIQGYANLAADDNIECQLRQEYLDIISKEASRMSDMAHEVLEYSRGEMNLVVGSVLSSDFIKGLNVTLKPLFDTAGVAFNCTDRLNAALYIDVDRIHRVILNLATNALDALVALDLDAEAGEFSITLSCQDQKIHISIVDNANGIPESIRATLFEPFVTSGKANGTGLGMAIVKQIITAHSGKIDFVTEIGAGTTFSIDIPMDLGDKLQLAKNSRDVTAALDNSSEPQPTNQKSVGNEQATAAVAEISETQKQKVQILLAEDNMVNQKMISTFLKKLGYFDVDIAGDGKKAIDAMSEKHYDLVLMDIEMPEMNGFEATECIRDLQSAVLDHEVSIIAMTGHSDQAAKTRCREVGMNDFISKPIKIDLLSQIIERGLIDAGFEK